MFHLTNLGKELAFLLARAERSPAVQKAADDAIEEAAQSVVEALPLAYHPIAAPILKRVAHMLEEKLAKAEEKQ